MLYYARLLEFVRKKIMQVSVINDDDNNDGDSSDDDDGPRELQRKIKQYVTGT